MTLHSIITEATGAAPLAAYLALVVPFLMLRHTKKVAAGAGADREQSQHFLLRPKLTVELQQTHNDAAFLNVLHDADSPVPVVDELRITVRNDNEFRSGTAVWGPWKLKYGCDGADLPGRTADPRTALARGDRTRWAMVPTTDPTMTADPHFWEDQYRGKPARVRLIAVVDARSWEYPMELVAGHEPVAALGGPLPAADVAAAV